MSEPEIGAFHRYEGNHPQRLADHMRTFGQTPVVTPSPVIGLQEISMNQGDNGLLDNLAPPDKFLNLLQRVATDPTLSSYVDEMESEGLDEQPRIHPEADPMDVLRYLRDRDQRHRRDELHDFDE